MARWVFINAVGATTISCLTLVAATYLAVSLYRQGRGKLRVRLLMGMVISDLLLGILALVQEAHYLAGRPFQTGSGGCDAMGFLLTTVLFTQHLWTLAIAIATYLLLKHPLASYTLLLEKHSWLVTPVIWGLSFLHAGIWWAYVGWSQGGAICYYAPALNPGIVDARDLVQFIPRALVFVVIVAFYSTLFQFLRRPDTIQLSSQFVSGGVNTSNEHSGHQMAKLFRRLAPTNEPGHTTPRRGEPAPVNPDAPWEAMEFVQIGHGRTWGQSPVQSYTPQFDPTRSTPVAGGILLNSRPPSPRQSTTRLILEETPELIRPDMERTSSTDTHGGSSFGGPTSARPSESETLVTPTMKYSETQLTPPGLVITHSLSPVLADGESTFDSKPVRTGLDDFDHDLRPDTLSFVESRRASGQTLKEFFQEHQVDPEAPIGQEPTASTGAPQMSAAAYFNRQASLLMLYFPLAYMIVFSVSLIRLIYDMVSDKPSPVLSLMSSWMVLSVGLIDGLVYGFAEFMVRRKVRRKMPDRM